MIASECDLIQCPSYPGDLVRTRYEGLPVFQCSECRSYLVETQRVSDIKQRLFKSKTVLLADSSAGDSDNAELLSCPRCGRQMAKEHARPPLSFHIDTCQECSFVWLDLGELARLQLEHEASPRGNDAKRFQERHREMTAAERAEFASNLAALPPGEASFEPTVGWS